jgi:predicted DNA-binding helix-hairpin-helix protein
MFYNTAMESLSKLRAMAGHMGLEPAEEVGVPRVVTPPPELKRNGEQPYTPTAASQVAPCGQVIVSRQAVQKNADLGVFHANMPGGKTIPLLKTLLTSACERNCHYCPFRAGRNYRRVTFAPEEMAQTFMQMFRAGLVEGLFLSSGIIGGGVKTQDKLLATVELLRQHYQFQGYVHLKIMPSAEHAQVERAMQLANRVSVNLEAPNEARLRTLAPLKGFATELLRPLQWVDAIRRAQPERQGWNGRWPSTTTQFVVGGGNESDLELLATTAYLTKRLGLQRAYFSGFHPVPDTPLENRAAVHPLREHRLYQASFLFRDYQFDLEEMPFTPEGNLPLDVDPKLAWARANLQETPLELNRADREQLLRVPGIGPKSATTILTARRRGTLHDLRDLQKLGVKTGRMEPFVLLNGRRPARQLALF